MITRRSGLLTAAYDGPEPYDPDDTFNGLAAYVGSATADDLDALIARYTATDDYLD